MRFASGVVLGVLALGLVGCNSNAPSEPVATNASTGGGATTPGATNNGEKLTKLKIDDIKVGTGPGAKNGDQLTMQYSGSLANGSVFDTNMKPDGQPFKFKLGAGTVIKGWDQGLVGMKEGGERKLSIPAALGYGAQSPSDKIPANSDLFFDVKLTKIRDLNNITVNDKKVGSGAAVKKGDTVSINYTSADDSGAIIDARNQTKPLTFKIGDDSVVPVIDQGIIGMKVGGERVLGVPGQYLHGGPTVTPGSVIDVDIHLVKIGK